jgi:hypothetical protein
VEHRYAYAPPMEGGMGGGGGLDTSNIISRRENLPVQQHIEKPNRKRNKHLNLSDELCMFVRHVCVTFICRYGWGPRKTGVTMRSVFVQNDKAVSRVLVGQRTSCSA